MNTIKAGDIVKYKSPLPDEEGELIVITEWNGDRGFGRHLNTGLSIPPVTLVRLDEIEVVGTINE